MPQRTVELSDLTSHDDLAIADRMTATLELERLLFRAADMDGLELERVHGDLRRYCERDTWGLVELRARLTEGARRIGEEDGPATRR